MVDRGDIFLGKLFSRREKDRDDLRVLADALDRAALAPRLTRDCSRHLSDPTLRQQAEQNWYILWGERLPV